MYILCRNHKFVCHLIPKVATRSLLQYFVRNPRQEYGAVHTSRAWLTRSYFHFAFMRNPHARLVSAYLNKVVNNYRKDVGKMLRPYGMYPDMAFDEFVKVICNQTDKRANEHWKSQHTFLGRMDFVGTMESINDDFDAICRTIGIKNYGLKRFNYTTNKGGWHYNYTENRDFVDFLGYYNKELYELVEKRYGKDIELYERIASQRCA